MPQFKGLSNAFNAAINMLDKAQYLEAIKASDDLEPDESALILLRVATRLGQFQVGLLWADLCLELTSKQRGGLKIAVHGAIGELLVRGGAYHHALTHMQILNSFRPKGSPDRQRHYSYLAIPLARLGCSSVAESYYMRAFVLAKQQSNTLTASLSLVRRAALTRYTGDNDYLLKSLAMMNELSQIDDRAALVMRLLCKAYQIENIPEYLLNVNALPHTVENIIEHFIDNHLNIPFGTQYDNSKIYSAIEVPKPKLISSSFQHLLPAELSNMNVNHHSELNAVLDYLFV